MSDQGTPTPDAPPEPAQPPPPETDGKPDGWLPDDHPVVKSMQAMRTELHEAQKTAKANADAAKRLAELEDNAKTQAERDAEARTAAEQRAVKAEADLLRMRVAAAKGIPADLADLLTGADEAEMGAVADRLLAMKGATPPPVAGSADAGPQGEAPAVKSIDERIADARKAGDTSLAISLNNQKLAAIATGR